MSPNTVTSPRQVRGMDSGPLWIISVSLASGSSAVPAPWRTELYRNLQKACYLNRTLQKARHFCGHFCPGAPVDHVTRAWARAYAAASPEGERIGWPDLHAHPVRRAATPPLTPEGGVVAEPWRAFELDGGCRVKVRGGLGSGRSWVGRSPGLADRRALTADGGVSGRCGGYLVFVELEEVVGGCN
jgi:hypothetical protein